MVSLVYLLGSLLIFSDSSGRKDFLASPLQLSFATVLVLALVTSALLPRWRRPVRAGPVGRRTRSGGPGGRDHPSRHRPGTRLGGVAIAVALAATTGSLVAYWSSRSGWGSDTCCRRHGGPGDGRRVRVRGAAVLPGEPGRGPGRRHRGHRPHCRSGRGRLVAAACFARCSRRRKLMLPNGCQPPCGYDLTEEVLDIQKSIHRAHRSRCRRRQPDRGHPVSAGAHHHPGLSLAFDRVATYPVFQNRPAGEDPATPTVAEISAVSEDGRTLIHTDALARRIGFLDISRADQPRGLGTPRWRSWATPRTSPPRSPWSGSTYWWW
ncbi:hypothetical protein NKG94_32750 [Micromonospora sp. M12]